jgi:dTDP-glucose 4,6-dehydratase
VSAAQSPGWPGQKVLVTGAGGFIGSHLVEALVRAGAEVRAFVRYNSRNDYGWLEDAGPDVRGEIEIFRGDLTNPEAVARALESRGRVLHLGALIPIPYSYVHPREFVAANVVGTLNVLEAARRVEVERIVHTSTSEVYGTPLSVPIPETAPLNAQSPYAATKVGADQLVSSYHASFDLPVVIARPFNTFGPRQSARAVIPTIVSSALSQDEITLGSTTPTRDFLYVEDTVQGLMRCAQAGEVEGEVINLGTGREIAIGDLAALILSELGLEKPIRGSDERRRPEGSEVMQLRADISKAERILDWSPTVTLAEGLRRTIEWLRTSIDAYKPAIYNI